MLTLFMLPVHCSLRLLPQLLLMQAAAAVEAGATMVNDVSGGTMDPRMHRQVCKRMCTLCPKVWQSNGPCVTVRI